jgi:peptidoglycan/LPS O-acetylase OafA/YrhL
MNRAKNNFDLLRLLAALQVAIIHGVEHMKIDMPRDWYSVVNSFPGVSIFFVVSGYLISGAYLRSKDLRSYARNRILRIYPGLWVCFGVTILLMLFFQKLDVPFWRIALWTLGQLTFVPHTPDYLRSFGTGSVNGSLWTIPVELQFYLILPVLMTFITRSTFRKVTVFVVLLALGIGYLWLRREYEGRLPTRVLLMCIVSWLYVFMVGVFLQLNPAFVEKFIAGKFLWWLTGYVGWTMLMRALGVPVEGNDATPLTTIPLGFLTISFALTAPGLADKLLRGNDISYGLYIYHMLVINTFVQTGQVGDTNKLVVAIALSIMLAMVSWRFVEAPALRLKRDSQHPVLKPQIVPLRGAD